MGRQRAVGHDHPDQAGLGASHGLPHSDRVELTERFIRHGDVMTLVNVERDPVYLTEPLIKTENFVLNRNVQPAIYQNWLSCQPDTEIATREVGIVPHY